MKQSILQKPLTYSYFNVTFVLIGINILVYFFNMMIPDTRIYMAMIPVLVIRDHTYWQFLTYMFTHGSMTHILFNMLGLFFFGASVERRMGSWEFLLFYLLTGVLAGIFSFIVYYFTGAYTVILLGASGAVYAVLLAYASYYPDSRIFIFGLIPIKASMMVLIYTALALFNQFTGSRGGVAHMTHLAGFGFAFLYFLIRLGINPIDSFTGKKQNPWR
ncbi:MAG: rhomboid family intramembrane serine protease [Spirochaetales bacterium]|nr:rhomboid family intramembrane serine protease [Spirochaetales bacterium]